jgi:hypothetical protein
MNHHQERNLPTEETELQPISSQTKTSTLLRDFKLAIVLLAAVSAVVQLLVNLFIQGA